MSDYAELTRGGTLTISRLLPGPIERVWSHIVDPELREQWFAAGPIEPRVGGTARFEFDHARISDEAPPEKYKDECAATLEGEVTRYEPPHVLGFTWPERDSPASEVTITLCEEDGGVRLLLVHERLEGAENKVGVSAGWHAHLDLLADAVAGEPARDFWNRHGPLEDVYRERLAGVL